MTITLGTALESLEGPHYKYRVLYEPKNNVKENKNYAILIVIILNVSC